MSNYNNNRFTPGKKANMRAFINKSFIRQYYDSADLTGEDYSCFCTQQKVIKTKQGWNDPSQTENTRISQILTGTLGGRITFGNGNENNIYYLGGREGQPGGLPRPLRNKF